MASGPDGEVLKKEFMLKRSQLKSKFKTVNFKSRWFVLTDRVLTYHDGSLAGGVGREKGRVALRDVQAVEFADDDGLGRRPNGFQIVYSLGIESIVLYIIAVHSDMRLAWMDAIRKACVKLGQGRFNTFYHPGVWLLKENRYSCCDSITKRSEGCQSVTYQYDAGSTNSYPATIDNDQSDSGPSPPSRGPPQSRPVPVPRPRPPVANGDQKNNNYKKAIARYDYQATEEGDLSLVVGEIYYILDESKQYWWKARNMSNAEGYIPANYVEEFVNDPSSLAQYSWYHPGLSRQQSEELLKNEKREGCFLVRDSSQPGMYTLSIYTQEVQEGMVRHYHIKKNRDGQYYLSEKHSFDSIPSLIHYHKHNSGGLVVRLRNPPMDRTSSLPATQGFGHDTWEIDPGDLEIFEELGKGQFGKVCRARFKKKQMDVAVKEMHSGTMKEDDFIDEARTMMAFSHKHLVQLYGVCTKHRPMYIVLEFMKHGALLQFLRKRKLNLLNKPDTLLEMCTQVCSAMKYLEEKQVIHRDLAARNCLVADNTIVKVADFGLARFVLDDEYTSSSGTKFPVKWAPPEVLSYTKFSSKSDVWAFGVLMWEIWTGGESPYGRKRNPEVVDFVCNRNGVLSKPESCPIAVYEVMNECWRKQPEQRPRFKELYDELTRVCNQQDYSS